MKHNWTYKKLGEVVKCYRGLTYSKADEVSVSSKMVLRSNNIDLDTHALNFDEIKCVREDLPIADDRKLKKDSIFICMSNGSMQHLGKVAYVDKDYDYAFGGFMGLIVPNPQEVFPKYVYYSLLAPNFLATILREGRGANINNLRFTDLENYSLPMPAKDEQESIVAELDGINRLIDLQEEQLREYDRLAQSLFYTTFGDPATNPKGWEVKKLGDIATVKIGPFGSLLHTSDYIKGGVPLVNPIHMKNGYVIADDNFTVSEQKAKELSSYRMSSGDFIFARRGDIGRCAIVTNKEDGFLCGTGSLFVRFDNTILPIYALFWTKCESFVDELTSQAKGATMLNINCGIVENLNIPLPPLALQQTFAVQIEAIEQQKALIRNSLEHTRTLLAARMQYYFE